MNKKGFTLIEMIAVIIILGIVMLIAIPAVTQSVRQSNESVYANTIMSYIQEVKLKYSEKYYGPFLNSNEIMVVPFKNIKLDKGTSTSSPFGPYNYEQSYIVVERTANGVKYYASIVDETRVGVLDVREDELNNDSIKKNMKTAFFQMINASYNCQNVVENGRTISKPVIPETGGSVFIFNNSNYKAVETRPYSQKEGYDCKNVYPIIIYEKV